jgi:hypothetical protein
MSASSSPYPQTSNSPNTTAYDHVLHPLTTNTPHSSMAAFDASTLFGPALHLPVRLSKPLKSTSIKYPKYTYFSYYFRTSHDRLMHTLQDMSLVDFVPSFYSADICDQNESHLPPFQPSLSYYTPVSEASDFSETLTPISLLPPGDIRGSPPPHVAAQRRGSVHLSPVPESIEVSTPSRPRSTSNTLHPRARIVTPEPQSRRNPSSGLGIEAGIPSTPVSSPRPRSLNTVTFISEPIPPPPRRFYTPIAPNPAGLRQLQSKKRSLSYEDENETSSKKRKMSESVSPAHEISDEDSFLLRLKDEEGLSWKDISQRFQDDLGKTVQIPALQMRLKRLRERMRVWTDVDVQALRMAHDYWVTNKFEIIASKVRLSVLTVSNLNL